jgi:hypothetical protein
MIFLSLPSLRDIPNHATGLPVSYKYREEFPSLPVYFSLNSILPLSVASLVQEVVGKLRLFLKKPLASNRKESNKWKDIFLEAFPSPISIMNQELKIGPSDLKENYTHFMGIALSLKWTEDYLGTGEISST